MSERTSERYAHQKPENCSPVEERLGRAGARVSLGLAQREAEVVRICRHLAEQIAAIAPPGIGKRDDVWDAVDPADRALLLALNAWTRSGADADKQRAREAYRTLLDAWRAAVAPSSERKTA